MKLCMLFLIFTFTSLAAVAQGLRPISQNNLSGIYGTLSNPANAAGGIDRFSFNLLGISADINNNALRTDLDYDLVRVVDRSPLQLEQGSLESFEVDAARKWVRKPVIAAQVDVLQFAAQVAVSKKITVYGFARERAFANFDKGEYTTLKYLVEGDNSQIESLINLSFDMRTIAYQELGIGGAMQIYENRQHYLKAGFTYKRINARAIYAVSIPSIESSLVDANIEVNGEFSILETALQVAKQNPLDFLLNPAMGSGHALDLGLVYEHRPRRLKSTYRRNNLKRKNKVFNGRNLTKYDYRVGLSLNDLGSVLFNASQVSTTTHRISAVFDFKELSQLSSEEYMQRVLDSSKTEVYRSSLGFKLPATLAISYDQRLRNGWFISAMYQQNMVKKDLHSFYQPSSMQVQLRKETRKCVYGFPAVIIPGTRTFTIGAYAHTGPFFIGTSNLGTLFLKKIYNPSFYTGLFYNIRYKADKTIENHNSFRTKRKRNHIWSGL